jgi:hypothetical protein
LSAQRPVPDQQQTIRSFGRAFMPGIHQQLEVLFRCQTTGIDRHHLILADPQFATHGDAAPGRIEQTGVDPPAPDFDPFETVFTEHIANGGGGTQGHRGGVMEPAQVTPGDWLKPTKPI